jgi:hypothetical protein
MRPRHELLEKERSQLLALLIDSPLDQICAKPAFQARLGNERANSILGLVGNSTIP